MTAETVYVAVDSPTGMKYALPDRHRAALDGGAPGVVIDHAGAGARAPVS